MGDIPVLPGINAAQSLHAKVKYIYFTGGSGVAFLASYSQDVSPVTNERLQYFFQGLSSDGQQYISVVYPVASKYLPNTAAEVPPETMTALQTDPEKYLADTATALEQTAPTDFTPDLNSLDAMFKSIRIGALPPTSTPVPAGPNLAGTSWYWRSFVKADGSQTTITEYDNYMLEFLAGGQVKILADCNKGSGTYQTSGTQITIQVTATTQASCPADSLGDQFISGLNASYAYAVQSGVLALFSNAGTMNLGPTVVVGTGTPIPAKGPVGPLWFWISFQGSDGTSVAPDDPDRYSLQLLPDGTAQMKADCNNATGTYNLSGSSLTIDVTSITDNKCKEGSLSQQYLNYLESAASFVLDGSNLSIALAADAGVMRFVK